MRASQSYATTSSDDNDDDDDGARALQASERECARRFCKRACARVYPRERARKDAPPLNCNR